MTRNLAWLRSRVARLLNSDINEEPDQDFSGGEDNPWELIDDAISEAAEDELELAKQEANSEVFILNAGTFSWPSGQAELTLDSRFVNEDIVRLDDETHAVPGELVWVLNRDARTLPDIFWVDRKTIRWGTDGPAETKTIRVFILPSCVDLTQPTDEPDFIPPKHRRLLIWSAAIVARLALDEDAVPQRWINRREQLRLSFWTALSKSRPRTPGWGEADNPIYVG
jgi:hypothetical protein